jgi:hypothetical protein
MDLRVNPMKTARDAAIAALAAEGFDATATPYSPLGIRGTAGRRSRHGSPTAASKCRTKAASSSDSP